MDFSSLHVLLNAESLNGQFDKLVAEGEVILYETVEHRLVKDNCTFTVLLAPGLAAKQVATTIKENPFLPYNQKLLVTELDGHALLFNKYCLSRLHMILITKKMELQHAKITINTFIALNEVLYSLDKNMPWIAFYNSSPEAGASQLHRHFQIIPLEFADIPYPFKHLSFNLNDMDLDPQIKTESCEAQHHRVMTLWKCYNQCDVKSPYNLLITRDRFIWIPRTSEIIVEGVSANALAFAGHLLVRTEDELKSLEWTRSIWARITKPNK